LLARAIENLAYCVAVNRTGVDGNQLTYLGGSAAIDFLGSPIVELGAEAGQVSVRLSYDKLQAHRERFPAWMDADRFELLD
jgi:predicted amidohydrolase